MEKFPCDLLLNSTHPISDRLRALFSLRNLKGPGPRNALILTEAVGAIGPNGIEHLKDAVNSDELCATDISPFKSVDPAAPATSCSSVEQLRFVWKVLLGEEKGMYERYSALVALRNEGGNEAVAAITDSLDSRSALLRREVAYVLGQLQDKAASAALYTILWDVNERPMVRHEAAETLGSIAVPLHVLSSSAVNVSSFVFSRCCPSSMPFCLSINFCVGKDSRGCKFMGKSWE